MKNIGVTTKLWCFWPKIGIFIAIICTATNTELKQGLLRMNKHFVIGYFLLFSIIFPFYLLSLDLK